MSAAIRRLLLLACSKLKRSDVGLLSALERYDGPAYRVLRRYLRTDQAADLDTCVVSAEFGLITADRPIQNYDRRMTPQRAEELRPELNDRLTELFSSHCYREVFICAGKAYRNALAGCYRMATPLMSVQEASGSQGKQLSDLRAWLYPKVTVSLPTCAQERRSQRITLRGREIAVTADEVLDIARRGIASSSREATRYQAWYVPVDGLRIGPKWLVSQLAGLPVRAFHSGEARRVLEQIGIEVRQT